MFAEAISEKDEPILKNLKNIETKLISDSNDFQIKFTFNPNQYFDNTQITKRYYLNESSNITKVDCNDIKWKAG